MHYSIPFVCAFGMLTVFASLIIIVILSSAMSAVVRKLEKPAQTGLHGSRRGQRSRWTAYSR